ncbi:MAG: hypothetical protein AB7G87_14120 [Clostridia bacterium]
MLYKIPLYVALLQSIPETFLIIQLGFIFFNIHINYKKSLIISLISAVISYIVRKLFTTFGIHTFLLLIALIFLIRVITKIHLMHSVVGVLTGALIAGVFQMVTTPLLLMVYGKIMSDLALEPWLNILFFLPSGLLMVLSYLIIRKNHFYLIDFNMYHKD